MADQDETRHTTAVQGLVWLLGGFLIICVLLFVLFLLYKSKDSASHKAEAASDIVEAIGEVAAQAGTHVADALSQSH